MRRLAFAALLLIAAAPALAAGPVPSTEVRKALDETGTAIAESALDSEGKARGDYIWRDGTWRPYEVAWHTGQAIEGLLAAYQVNHDPKLLAKARQAGDWWISQEFKSGPLKGLMNAAHGEKLGRLINWTTIGDGTAGLYSLTRVTGDKRYADSATRSIRWLIANTEVPGDQGLFYNIIDPATGKVWTDRTPHEPNLTNPPVTKVARPNIEGYPFYDACLYTGDKSLCDRHLKLAVKTAARQSPNGFWMEFEPNDSQTGSVHARFNTWNAEALLTAYALRKDPAFLEAALRNARANAKLLKPDGSFDYDQNADGTSGSVSPTGSATAFAGILWLKLRALGYTEFDPQIHAAARWLIANRFATNHPDPNVRGLVVELRNKRGVVLQREIGTGFAARFFADYLKAFP